MLFSTRAARWVVAVSLLAAVAAKLAAMGEFARLTSTFTIFPWPIRRLLPLLIPLSELVVAYALFLPVLRRTGLLLATALLVVFTAYLAWAIAHPWAPDCKCYGLLSLAADARTNNVISMGRNIFLLALLALACFEHRALRWAVKP